MGLMSAAENNRRQRTIARWAALMALGELGGEGIISHARWWAEERHTCGLEWRKAWTGSLFRTCRGDRDWFTPTGRREAAFHKGSNARKVEEWRLTDAGWAAYYEARRLLLKPKSNVLGEGSQ